MDQEKLINVSVAQPARPPLRPLSRRLALNMFLAGVIGVLGGLGIAFAIEYYLDHTFTTGEEMERRLGLAHLASIPEEV
jgi:capsular polysaccharide biosynthesis protein